MSYRLIPVRVFFFRVIFAPARSLLGPARLLIFGSGANSLQTAKRKIATDHFTFRQYRYFTTSSDTTSNPYVVFVVGPDHAESESTD